MSKPELTIHQPTGVRLQKILAQAGLGSRRACEELIARGRVNVNGQLITELGIRIDPHSAVVKVDGKRVDITPDRITLVLNKPAGVISAMSDPSGKPCLDQFVRDIPERLFHVGRLDGETTGVLLLTNDGDLAHKLAHPSFNVPKIYVAKVRGKLRPEILTQLRTGIELDDGPIRVSNARLLAARPEASLVEVELTEGRNRIVRRMLDAVGHPVLELARIQFGSVRLGNLGLGQSRVLSPQEVGELLALAHID